MKACPAGQCNNQCPPQPEWTCSLWQSVHTKNQTIEQGNTGKSAFAKWIALNYNAWYTTGGAYKDLAQAYDEQPDIAIFDCARSTEDSISYRFLKCLKQGIISKIKYFSRSAWIKIPHIIVFANFKPCTSNEYDNNGRLTRKTVLSPDRMYYINLIVSFFFQIIHSFPKKQTLTIEALGGINEWTTLAYMPWRSCVMVTLRLFPLHSWTRVRDKALNSSNVS